VFLQKFAKNNLCLPSLDFSPKSEVQFQRTGFTKQFHMKKKAEIELRLTLTKIVWIGSVIVCIVKES